MRTHTPAAAAQGIVPQWSFADRLRKARRECTPYNQEEMADALGVGLKAYSSWEAGKNPPRDIVKVAANLERVTGVPRQWFIGWADSLTKDYGSDVSSRKGRNRSRTRPTGRTDFTSPRGRLA